MLNSWESLKQEEHAHIMSHTVHLLTKPVLYRRVTLDLQAQLFVELIAIYNIKLTINLSRLTDQQKLLYCHWRRI